MTTPYPKIFNELQQWYKISESSTVKVKTTFQKHLTPLLKANGFHEILNVHYTYATKPITPSN